MHPKSPTLSSKTSLHLASPISSDKVSFVEKRWKKSKALLSLLFVSTFAHLDFFCCWVELIYQTFLKACWQNCNNILLWQNMNSSLDLFICERKNAELSQDFILKTTAALRISASVSDDNWWKPQNAPERNHDQLLSLWRYFCCL